MERREPAKQKASISTSVSTRIQNPELVRKKHLLIARKASKLFIRKGYDNTSMRDVSRATKIAIGNLYDYIEKKEDILTLVFEVYHRSIEDSSFFNEIYYGEEEGPEENLKQFLYASLKMIHNFRDEVTLMFRESNRLPKPILKEAMERESRQIGALESFLRKGMDRGAFKIQDPFFTANMIVFQMVIGALRLWSFKRVYSIEELHDRIVESIVQSVVKNPE